MRFAPLALIAAIGCQSTPNELDRMRELWGNEGGTDYEFTVQRSCFCPDVEPIRVTVMGGEAVQAIRQTLDAPTEIDPADFEPWFTVEGLFDAAEAALDDADDVVVSYDPDSGFPTDLQIDWITNAVDDEEGYTASDLILGGPATGLTD